MLLLNFYVSLGGSSVHPQVQRTRRHQQLWRLRRGGDPRLLHWEMCQGVCRVLELESERGRKKEVGRVKCRLVKWKTYGESTVSCPITSTSFKKRKKWDGEGEKRARRLITSSVAFSVAFLLYFIYYSVLFMDPFMMKVCFRFMDVGNPSLI